MPQCRLCNEYFPFRLNIEGKKRNLKNRKYCLNCSSFGSKNTRILDHETRIAKGLMITDCICADCGRKYTYKREGKSKTRCNSCYTRRSRALARVRAYAYKGNKCLVCGYDRCMENLHFHHVNPEEKLFDVGTNINLSWERVKNELDKCVVLCSIHHTELHVGLIDTDDVINLENIRRQAMCL